MEIYAVNAGVNAATMYITQSLDYLVNQLGDGCTMPTRACASQMAAERQQATQEKNASTANGNLTVGVSLSAHVATLGVGGGASVSIDSLSNVCISGSFCTTAGPGLFFGVGPEVSLQNGALSSGTGYQSGVFGVGGAGVLEGFQLTKGQDGNVGATIGVKGQAGFGKGAGVIGCQTVSVCIKN